jgi:hypothetical protein
MLSPNGGAMATFQALSLTASSSAKTRRSLSSRWGGPAEDACCAGSQNTSATRRIGPNAVKQILEPRPH